MLAALFALGLSLLTETPGAAPPGENAFPFSLVSYGGLGFLALGAILAVRVLFVRETKSLERERERADRYEEQIRQLNRDIHEKYIPVLTRTTEELAKATAVITLALNSRRGHG